jgi:hypothetical protein
VLQKAQDIGATTPRERDYIAALAALYKDHATVPHRQRALPYEPAMEKLAATSPDDVEAEIPICAVKKRPSRRHRLCHSSTIYSGRLDPADR